MIESSSDKKRLFYMIVLILTLITMIIGATLAYLKFVASQKEDSTILYTGTLKINYLDGKYIENPYLLPQNSVDYNTYDNVYRNNFTITSTGTLDQKIFIDMEIDINEFNENELKYVLYNNNGKQLASGFVPTKGTINLISNTYLGHGESAKYTLIIWWTSTDEDQNHETGRKISGKINAEAIQIKY